MRGTTVLSLLIALPLLALADDKSRTYTFTKDDAGKLPAGWTADKTGTGNGSVWKVVEDDTAPSKKGYALAQTAEAPSLFYNLCVANDANLKDVEVSVAFKAVKGKRDQGGGVLWRYQDASNYYVARYNPLEDNFRLYKVVAGKRTQLESKDLEAPAGRWHTLKVTMKGNEIACWLNGVKHLEAKDDAFEKAGKVGFWTKADAQTYFDDFRVSGK